MSAIFVVFTFAFFKKRPITEDRGVKQVFHTKKAKAIWNDLTIHARSVIEKAHRGISEKG